MASMRSQFRLERYALSAATASKSSKGRALTSLPSCEPLASPVSDFHAGNRHEDAGYSGMELRPISMFRPLGTKVSAFDIVFGE